MIQELTSKFIGKRIGKVLRRMYTRTSMRPAGRMPTILTSAATLTAGVALVYFLARSNLNPVSILPGSGRSASLPPYVHRCNYVHPVHTMTKKDDRGSEDITGLGAMESVFRPSFTTPMPRNLWQTHRTHKGVTTMVACANKSWSRWNPTWSHFFLDDESMYQVMAQHYDADFIEKFRSLPLGVMRADFFRCDCVRPM